jgi:hypothetical protein
VIEGLDTGAGRGKRYYEKASITRINHSGKVWNTRPYNCFSKECACTAVGEVP